MSDLGPPGTESDFYFVQADDPATAVGRIIELVKTRIPKRFGLDPIRDILLLLGAGPHLAPMPRTHLSGSAGLSGTNVISHPAKNHHPVDQPPTLSVPHYKVFAAVGV